MLQTNKILLVMPHMIGGGAERVGALLMNSFANRGYKTEVLLTSDRANDVVRCDLDDKTTLTLLPEELGPDSFAQKIKYSVLLKIFAQVFCNLFELFRLPVPADLAKASLYVQYHREIGRLREKLKNEPDTAVIAFLQPAIPIVMLACRKLPNRVIFSERGDPARLMRKRYGRKFIEKYYPRADAAVFQTEAARAVYPESVAAKGVVIPNPLKSGLPQPYTGEREKRVAAFCRISPEKNLTMLIKAFSLFFKTHPDYSLRIYGDAANDEGKNEAERLRSLIAENGLSTAVQMLPFSADVHGEILRDMMYVNSSDREGLSNAMLEALAIGLPSICTDCPVGGARAVIRSEENGLLIPVGDVEALRLAMERIADDKALRDKLSANASLLREEYSRETISEKWVELL